MEVPKDKLLRHEVTWPALSQEFDGKLKRMLKGE